MDKLEKKMSTGIVIPVLKSLDARRVENGVVGPGTPDINFIEGWVELKALKAWPRRADTPVRPKIRPDQRVWLRTRWYRGGVSLLMLKVYEDDTWLVFDGHTAATKIGQLTRAEMFEQAVWSHTREKQVTLKDSMLAFYTNFRHPGAVR